MGRANPRYGRHHPTDWGPKAQKKVKANPEATLCFMTEVMMQVAGLFLHVVHSTHMWAKYTDKIKIA